LFTGPFHQNNKEVLRQLKHINDNSGNRIQSLYFKQLELKTYAKELWHTKTIFNKDRLILEFSRTNNFGQSWTKPTFILLLITSIFGAVMQIVNSPELSITPSFSLIDIKHTWQVIYSNIEIIPKLLNPTHKLENIINDQVNHPFALYSIDIIYKIVYAFFVFQIINAFRKFYK